MALEKLNLGPLNEDEAHDEANMLRAHLGEPRENEKLPNDETRAEERRPTPEDLDRALSDIEELRRLVRENPDPESLRPLMRVFDRVLLTPLLGAAFVVRLTHALAGDKSRSIEVRWAKGKELWTDPAIEIVFSDAESKLRRLKGRGEKFGKEEAVANRETL